MSRSYRIGLIPGDGIGPEVTEQSKLVVEALSKRFGFDVLWTTYPFGAEHYLATGETVPQDALEEIGSLDALLLGAIGDPRVPPGVLERGILLQLRFHFNQYVNLRPVESYGRPGPLGPVEAVVVRENTEDLYVGIGGTGDGAVNLSMGVQRGSYDMKGQISAFTSPPKRFSLQVAWHTFEAAERICRYAFDMALDMGVDQVVLASKSNAVKDLYGLFEEACRSVAEEYESVSLKVENVDALCYRLVRSPGSYGIILCPNMFGDIVSDLLAALGGGMGMAPSGNIGEGLCMFEPVHGSAPDIAGKDRANPLGSILSSAMMLEHLGEGEAARAAREAVRIYMSQSTPEELPLEMGGHLGDEKGWGTDTGAAGGFPMNGASMTVRALEELGVKMAFGIPGGPVIPLYDGLYHSSIRHVLTRHEQAAAHGADAYGRITGRPGVCVATSGPGATNLMTGIANAYLDSSPMVALVGQVPRWAIGSDAFQEADVMGATLSMVKHSFRASAPREIPGILKGAFYLASTGRPGPVLVELPLDVQRAEGEYSMPREVTFRGYQPPQEDLSWTDQAVELLMKSQRPLILAGGGVVRDFAFQQLMDLAEASNLPVATTLMGKGSIPEDHPLSLGLAGMHGTPSANRAMVESDLIIAVGVRFSDRTTGDREAFAKDAAIVHLDIDPSEHRKNVRAFVHGTVSARRALGALRERLGGWRSRDWAPLMAPWDSQEGNSADGAIRPREVMRALREITKGDAVFTTEVGQNQMWAALHLKIKRPGTFITSGGLGTMGFGLPAAMGIAAADTGLPAVCIAGDGSLMMNIQELDTLARYDLPVKVVLLNNRCLGMVRQWQELFFDKRYSNTIYHRSPDFVGIAEAMGVKGFRAERGDQLIGTLERAFEHPGPALVDIWIPKEELVMPMVPPGRSLEEMMMES